HLLRPLTVLPPFPTRRSSDLPATVPVGFAPPGFLETEADYQNAPEGTIVACEDSPPWHKFDSAWLSTITYGRSNDKSMTGVIRRDRKSTRLNSSHVSISYAVF